jgi:hypothetical protein
MRYLLAYALSNAGPGDITMTVGRGIKSIGRLNDDMWDTLTERCSRFQRPMGRELVRLLAFALQTSANRDLAIIEEMMQRRGRVSGELQSPA